MQNFMQIPPRGAFRQMGETYAKKFLYLFQDLQVVNRSKVFTFSIL